MLSISLGPVALPLAPLLLLLAVWVSSWLATWLLLRHGGPAADRRAADDAGNAVFVAAGVGLLAARGVYLALNAEPYLASPLMALDVRDGGWHAPTGWVVGLAWLAWRGARVPPLRRPLARAVAAGAALWWLASLLAGAGLAAPMPTVALATLHGGTPLDLRQAAAGRPVVVNLWASWCGPCRQEMPLLAAAQQREQAVGFLFVNQGESAAAVAAYLATLGTPLREVLLDRGSTLGPAVGSRGLPTTLFYDARGELIDAHFGVLNAPALESRLRRLRGAR